MELADSQRHPVGTQQAVSSFEAIPGGIDEDNAGTISFPDPEIMKTTAGKDNDI